MRIGEFAAMTETTPRMLRHYEQQGLLRPAGRGDNGYREYDDSQIQRVRQINELVQAGLPTRLIAGMLDALTDANGIYPEHVEPSTVQTVQDEWERMCRCVDCMAQRRDALRAYLDHLAAELPQ